MLVCGFCLSAPQNLSIRLRPCHPTSHGLSRTLRRVCFQKHPNSHGFLLNLAPSPSRPSLPLRALLSDASIQDIFNNQVLLAVVTSSLIGQVFKPFAAALQGKGFNWKLIMSSGGMPSSHSACVAAACTSLALERGLADSLFGLSVVFAGIVMYDAQGVRRAVGKQAEVINTLVVPNPAVAAYKKSSATRGEFMAPSSQRKSSRMATVLDEQSSNANDKALKGGSINRSEEFMEIAKTLPSVEAGQVNLQEIGDLDGWRHIPLTESVGHTKVEVLVGCLWGIIYTLALSHFTELTLIQTMHS